jgi:hypothetical protein
MTLSAIFRRFAASSFLRLPAILPSARAAARPAEVRSRIMARSNSANDPTICIIIRPAGVVVSMFSVTERKPAATSAICSMMCNTSLSDRDNRSSSSVYILSVPDAVDDDIASASLKYSAPIALWQLPNSMLASHRGHERQPPNSPLENVKRVGPAGGTSLTAPNLPEPGIALVPRLCPRPRLDTAASPPSDPRRSIGL